MGIVFPESWIITVDNIEEYFRAGWNVNVFSEGPGRIAPMPAALGGDASTWPKLVQYAGYKAGLVRIVLAKARYALLPYTSLLYVKNSHIQITGFIFGSSTAEGLTRGVPGAVLVQLPGGTDEAVVKVFSDLGRRDQVGTRIYQTGLGTVYHEMTHAWIIDSRNEDNEMKSLFDDGVKAFSGATGSTGAKLDPETAFMEAAASYVEKRVLAWSTALDRLNVVRSMAGASNPEALENYIAETVDGYNAAHDVQNYGRVGLDEIVNPPLPATLRTRFDAKLLDNQPLVGRFEETALGEILAGL
jgi:hypothetical protein